MLKIKSNKIPEESLNYLTPGKIYFAYLSDDIFPSTSLYRFVDDNNKFRYTFLKNSLHLKGGDWELINDNL